MSSITPKSGVPVLVTRPIGGYATAAYAPATGQAYSRDLERFADWCAAQSPALAPLPALPATVAGYLAALADAGYSAATIKRRRAAISTAHRLAGHPNAARDPAVAITERGIRRTIGTKPQRKAALHGDLLAQVLALIPSDTVADLRDRALLLVGFTGCLRRGEMTALDHEDITVRPGGLLVVVRRSKTDQEMRGEAVGLVDGTTAQTCPRRAWLAWSEAARISDGPAWRGVNRHGQVGTVRLHAGTVARIIKLRAEAAGLDPATFAGISLRSGWATTASRAGVTERDIMHQGRWRSSASVDVYVRQARPLGPADPTHATRL